MKFPHPLTIALFLALLLVVAWLNNRVWGGVQIFATPDPHPLKAPYVSFGWPVIYWTESTLNGSMLIQFRAFALSLAGCLLITFIPAFTLNRLLRRTLHIHLPSAVLLMLAAAVLLFLNVRIRIDDSWLHATQLQGWPQAFNVSGEEGSTWILQSLAANLLVALAILSLALLLSEFLLARRKSPREVTP